MRRWIRWAARLYPRSWRERYGEEFQALLDDVNPGWRDLADVARGGFIMRLTTDPIHVKLAAAMALAGAILASGASFVVPNRYVSTAFLRFTASSPEGDITDRVSQIQQEVLSRGSLTELIRRPSLNLYRGERQRVPMEDVVELMRRDIVMRRLDAGTLSISFGYPDAEMAQAVARELSARMVQSNRNVDGAREVAWRRVLNRPEPPPPGDNLAVLEPAQASKVIAPNRLAFTAWGLASGMLLGLLAASLKRQRRRTLQMAGFAAAGCAAGIAVSFLLPVTYISTAVMQRRGPIVPERLLGAMAPVPMAEWLPQIANQVLSRQSLAEVIQRPYLDLYPNERTRKPLEDVIDTMRRAIRIQPIQPSAFSISFSYSELSKAQRVVAELVTRFANENIRAERARWENAHEPEEVGKLIEYKMGAALEIIDSASLPETPTSPNRTVVAALGLVLGLILGAIRFSGMWAIRHRPA